MNASPCLALALLLTPGFLPARTWTNAQGITIEADLIDVERGWALLEMDGQRYEVPLENLSEANRQFAADWLATRESAGSEGTPAPVAASEAAPYGENGLPFPPGWDRTQPLEADLPTTFDSIDRVEVETVEENPAASDFRYQSQHFHFKADRQLTTSVVTAVATLLEATRHVVEQMPWGMPIVNSRREDGRLEVELYLDVEGYVAAGATRGSGGTAIGDRFLVLLNQIGVRVTGGTDGRVILDDIENSAVLTHEITHVFRNLADGPLPTWAIEGFAEYLEAYEYSDRGVYDRGDPLAAVNNRRGSVLEMSVPLDEFLILPHRAFIDYGEQGMGRGALVNYWAAHALMTFFWEADQPDDDERPGEPIRAYLRAIYSGEDAASARRHLLAGRSYEELQEDIARGLSRSIDIEFLPLPDETAE